MMIKARIRRNKFSILIFVVTFCAILILKVSPSKMPNYQDSISNVVSFSSLATAIFMAALAFVPKLSAGWLRKLGTDRKFLERIIIATFLYFITSVLAIIIISVFPDMAKSYISIMSVALMFGCLSAAISESIYIFKIIFVTN
ncbi:hypothetical protein [Levilactobacillus enshiensis]|uniref:hypothetical protein n=1 Tax=Levilactobacillus enshiensis TaxID=2590213 RepID=UPI001179FCAB|nr:hypothetical protein [Levilactobacillus enshiensis]